MSNLKRDDWLERGLAILVAEGQEVLTIDALCQRFGVTKGSFYHHFKNRQAFLEALLQFWEEKFTTQFIIASLEGETPLEQLARLQAQVISTYGTDEVVIRAWAQSDPLAREYQERVDQRRLSFLRELLTQVFDDPQIAAVMADLQYAILIGSAQILPALSANDLQAMYHLLSKISLSTKDDR
jgi:AcrR family transcriptional regulator